MGIYEIKKPKKINSFSVTLFLIVVTVGYLGYWYLPIWWPVFQITGIMKGICNDAYRNPNNDELLDKLVKETKRTGLNLTKENFSIYRSPYPEGELPKEPGTRENFIKRGKTCELTFSYGKPYELPLTGGKVVNLAWEKTIVTDLSVVHY
jgi:hypothetical protein